MEPFSFFLFVAIFISFILLCSKAFGGSPKRNYPGPGVLETIWGFLTEKHVHILLSKWSKKYGPIYTVFLGIERYFILNDMKIIREAFSSNECSGRPFIVSSDPFFTGAQGIVNAEGEPWQEHRNFAVSTLKTMGLGKPEMADLIMEEVSSALDSLEGHQKQRFVIHKHFHIPILNALWIVVAKKRLQTTTETKAPIMNLLSNLEVIIGNPVICLNKNIAKLIPWLPIWKNYRQAYKDTAHFFDGVVQKHRETMTSGEPRDLIDAYLRKIDSLKDGDTSVFYEGKHFNALLYDVVTAGSDTTSFTLEWVILYLVRYPQVQAKLRRELKRVVGSNRLPVLSDRVNLGIVEAAIYEATRLRPIVPFGAPHRLHDDFTLGGQVLPKGSHVAANMYSLHQDPSVWEDPEEFKPERFLNEEGQLVRPFPENFQPFSLAKRKCIGDRLALDTLFLFVSGIFHKFELRAHDTCPKPTLDPRVGLMLSPQDFPVHIKLNDDHAD